MVEIVKLSNENISQYLRLLKQLSPQAALSDYTASYLIRCLQNQDTKDIYLAILDYKVVGTVSILYEAKANRPPSGQNNITAMIGHIEDVVVDEGHRRKGIGKSLIQFAIEKAKEINCYKIVLDCDEKNVAFYQACGLNLNGISMRINL